MFLTGKYNLAVCGLQGESGLPYLSRVIRMKNPYQQVGKRIRLIRKEAGLTQAELAEKSGLSDNFVGLIERGVAHPTLEKLDQIADALKVRIGDFFDGEENEQGKEQAIKEIGRFLSKRQENDARFVLSVCSALRENYPAKGR